MEYSELSLCSNAQSFGDSLMLSLGSGFLPFHNSIYDNVPRTHQNLILSEKKRHLRHDCDSSPILEN